MSISSESLKTLVQLGANVEVPSGLYSAETIKTVVLLAKNKGVHVKIHCDGYSVETLKVIAQTGGKHVTLVL